MLLSPLTPLETTLNYRFTAASLLRQAVTHRSYGTPHNERLEFVGDAVLNCVIAQALFERFPLLDEGALSRSRAGLVNRETLARLARQMELSQHLLLGEGELKNGGSQRVSILADALEALFGAVFLDGGFEAAQQVIVTVYGEILKEADPEQLGKDAKTRLQEWLQARRLPLPEYVVTEIRGEAHVQKFVVECRISPLEVVASGEGNSRRAAEQLAADMAWQQLQTQPKTTQPRKAPIRKA
ncbi:MAG: ribonuclease III [Burkholderiales bacterium]|jgi:ribonuclease-3|nr:ribonuclease III [Burkholderiales bacterium]